MFGGEEFYEDFSYVIWLYTWMETAACALWVGKPDMWEIYSQVRQDIHGLQVM